MRTPEIKGIFVELRLTTVATGSILNFQDVPQLKFAYVHEISAFTDSQITRTPSGLSVFENAAAKEMLMTFVEEQDNKFEYVPYYDLVPANNAGLVRKFNNLKININKSNVLIGGTTATANKALAFYIKYSLQPVLR